MCIKLSTVKIPQIKGFFEDAIKNHPEKVDSFTGNPLVIHKLSTCFGYSYENHQRNPHNDNK